jgi:hypothetical protein
MRDVKELPHVHAHTSFLNASRTARFHGLLPDFLTS